MRYNKIPFKFYANYKSYGQQNLSTNKETKPNEGSNNILAANLKEGVVVVD